MSLHMKVWAEFLIANQTFQRIIGVFCLKKGGLISENFSNYSETVISHIILWYEEWNFVSEILDST